MAFIILGEMNYFYLFVAVGVLEVVDDVLKNRLSASEERLFQRDRGAERTVHLYGLRRKHDGAGVIAQLHLGLGNPRLKEGVPLRVEGCVKPLRGI